MFGRTLLTSDVLQVGNQYVFTFESGEWFFFDSTGDIQVGLNERMANIGAISSVIRGLFSDRYIVTVIPTDEVSLNTWLMAFDASWKDMGYDHITFITSEGGTVSTQPGGIVELIPNIGGTAGRTVTEIIKPLFPYILIGIVVYAGIKMLPEIIQGRRSYRRSYR